MVKGKMRATWWMAGFAAVTAAAVPGYGRPRPRAQVGEAAPGLTLMSTEGESVSLSDFKGKVVVLEWTNHQCPVVQRYVEKQKTMQATQSKFKSRGVVWLGVDSSHSCEDSIDAIKAFRKKNGIDYPTLLDASGRVGRLYSAKATPHMFVIDTKGVLVYSGSMDDDKYGGSEKTRDYVAEAIEACLAGSTVAVSKTEPFGCSVKYKKRK